MVLQSMITPMSREIHWLAVEKPIIFNVLLFNFKCLNKLFLSFLALWNINTTPSLRSSSKQLLVIAHSNTKEDRTIFQFLYSNFIFIKYKSCLPSFLLCSSYYYEVRTVNLRRSFYWEFYRSTEHHLHTTHHKIHWWFKHRANYVGSTSNEFDIRFRNVCY